MPRPTKEPPPQKLLSTSELARRSGLNRATVRERLQKEGVEPKQAKAREKLYDHDEALTALGADLRSDLRKAQTEKVATEAERARLKLDKERGELVPLEDARADLTVIIKRIHQHFAVIGPRELAQQLRRAKTAEFERLLKEDAEQFFNDLRAEYEGYL